MAHDLLHENGDTGVNDDQATPAPLLDGAPDTTSAVPGSVVVVRRRTWPALVAFALPVVLALVAVVALWGSVGGGGSTAPVQVPAGETYTYVIPAGTAEKMANNQFVADILPEFVSLNVGDSIVVENLDSATHTFGPLTVRANETTSLDFINPGIYFGLCTVGQHDSITIQVT
jgi:hypothetical protein